MTAMERLRAQLKAGEKPKVADVQLILEEYTTALRQLAWYKRNYIRLAQAKHEPIITVTTEKANA